MKMKMLSTLAGLAALTAGAVPVQASEAYDGAVCGLLPYRLDGPARFDGPREPAPVKATVGKQNVATFAWDLARPSFLASEVAESIQKGVDLDLLRQRFGDGLSLSEYMLHAAKAYADAPPPPPADDPRRLLPARRLLTFHQIYSLSSASFETVAAELGAQTVEPTKPSSPEALAAAAGAWRKAYALVARAEGDDKRIELLASNLAEADVLEREAFVCVAEAFRITAAGGDASAAKAAVKRWGSRPALNARALPRDARSAFFDYEDAGDDLSGLIEALPAGETSADGFQKIARAFAKFATAARSFGEVRRVAE